MWFTVFIFGCGNLRPGGATRGKWRILDGKDESGLFSYSELRRWFPLPMSIKDRVSGALRNKH
jgi:hypothetical protein